MLVSHHEPRLPDHQHKMCIRVGEKNTKQKKWIVINKFFLTILKIRLLRKGKLKGTNIWKKFEGKKIWKKKISIPNLRSLHRIHRFLPGRQGITLSDGRSKVHLQFGEICEMCRPQGVKGKTLNIMVPEATRQINCHIPTIFRLMSISSKFTTLSHLLV